MTRFPIFPNGAVITLLLAAVAVFLCGCGLTTPRQDPSRFFVLSSVVDMPADAELDGPAIAVGRIDMPAYTDRPQIVTRKGTNELHFSEYNRWAESLTESFSRALGQNLGALLKTDRVTTHPWLRSFYRDYEIFVSVLAFEAYPERGSVSLTARWRIKSTQQDVGIIGESMINLSEPLSSDGYAGIVEAWDRAIGALSGEIAAAITAAE